MAAPAIIWRNPNVVQRRRLWNQARHDAECRLYIVCGLLPETTVNGKVCPTWRSSRAARPCARRAVQIGARGQGLERSCKPIGCILIVSLQLTLRPRILLLT